MNVKDALAKSTIESPVTQAYFAILHAPHPETGEHHYFLMKGKDGNKMRIFGGEANGGETPLQAIMRETAEETGFIDQPTGEITNPVLYEILETALIEGFQEQERTPIYSKDHALTDSEIAKGWHPSQNHVYEIECDYDLLTTLEKSSAMAKTPEGQGTCLLSASEIIEIGAGCFRHPYESNAIGIHMFGAEALNPESSFEFIS